MNRIPIYYNEIKTKYNKSLTNNGIFAHRSSETSFRIPEDATYAEEQYLRCKMQISETLSCLYALYYLDGSMTLEQYNAYVALLEKSMEELRTRLSIKSYNLVVVENGEVKDVLNFDNQYTLNNFTKEIMDCSYTELDNFMAVKDAYRGSKVFETKYVLSNDNVFEVFKAGR